MFMKIEKNISFARGQWKKFGSDAGHLACWPAVVNQLSGSILTHWYMMCALQFVSFPTALVSAVHSLNFWKSTTTGPPLTSTCSWKDSPICWCKLLWCVVLVLINTDLPSHGFEVLENQEHYLKLEKIYMPQLFGWPRSLCCSPPAGHTSTPTVMHLWTPWYMVSPIPAGSHLTD